MISKTMLKQGYVSNPQVTYKQCHYVLSYQGYYGMKPTDIMNAILPEVPQPDIITRTLLPSKA